MEKIRLIPGVKQYDLGHQLVSFSKINYDDNLTCYEEELLLGFVDESAPVNMHFYVDKSLNNEAYIINVLVDSIDIYYASDVGKHNAILTLVQLLKEVANLSECHIFDEPDFAIRSIMIDISRNKVHKVETLKKIIDELALVKLNELQLYVEGRAFYFESFSQYYEDKNDFLTGDDVLELTDYCLKRNINLIPNLNCFGHMAFWVNQPELKHLALEKNFYWEENGLRGYVTSINPDSEEACSMLYTLFDDLLKYYPNVDKVTIGGDEPFDLLFPKKHPLADAIYEKHISNVADRMNARGLTPWMWGDVVKIYPSLLDKINAKFLEWGYEPGQFNDENCSFYQKYNKEFVVCCGTSCWNDMAGRMDNMFTNYYEAAYYGKKYGASGIMITDWNDGGSYSQLPTNLLCYVYGACYAWDYQSVDKEAVIQYLDNFVFNAKLASSIIELGRYTSCQDNPKTGFSKLFTMIYCHQMDGINYDIGAYSDCTALFNRNEVLNHQECLKTEGFLDEWLKNFTYLEDNQYCKEIMFAYKLLRHALNANKAYLRLRNIDCDIKTIEDLYQDLDEIIKEYSLIWYYRNKKSDYYYSERRLKMLKFRYSHILSLMKGDF